MTVTTSTTSGDGPVEQREDLVTLTIDDFEISVPKGTLVIRAAELIGIQIPRFCDHPLLEPAGACRQCLVEVVDAGNGRGMPKPQTSCTLPVAEGMKVRTQLTSPVADKAQQGQMEFLLINHPLDCPMCDKGGECPLQNQAMSNGRGESRYEGKKRLYPKPLAISSQILLDRERCILCARCTRFQDEIAGDRFIDMLERGALQQVGIYEKEPLESYFSGNTIQICPVGALTSAAYRFRARPFDLVSVTTMCEHCAAGCELRTDYRRGKVMRRLAGDDPRVNEEWNCDKGRFAFAYAGLPDRLTHPLVRDEESGELVPASWPEAAAIAARGLAEARGKAGVLVGGRVTIEDAYGYAKFARLALGTNNIDFRARAHSVEETDFLAAYVAGRGLGVTYSDLENAPAVLLAGLETEEESPIVFLRLRKANRKKGLRVFAVAPFATPGLRKVNGQLVPAAPGTEAELLDAIADQDNRVADIAEALRAPGAVVLVGERLAAIPGALTAAMRVSRETGARLAWIPRRAGERGALEAGALPTLLPGGRPVHDAAARVDVGAVWGVESLPPLAGLDTAGMLRDAKSGDLQALVVGGVEIADLPDPAAARAALEAVPFLVSLEIRRSEVTEFADVVLPVATVTEKAGTFLDWEGRERVFPQVFDGVGSMSDARVLTALADEMDQRLGLYTPEQARAELAEFGPWEGSRAVGPAVPAAEPPLPGSGQAVLATWRMLLDLGRLQDGEPHLAGTARAPVVRLSAATAAELGVTDNEPVTVATERGKITLPLAVTEMPDRVVWLPQNSAGSQVYSTLGVTAGALVTVAAGGAR